MTNQIVPEAVEIISPNADVTNRLFVTIEGQDYQRSLEELDLSFDASDTEILQKVAPVIREGFGVDITNYYKVRKAVANHNIYIIPASVAGI